jgi:hypothetical protein
MRQGSSSGRLLVICVEEVNSLNLIFLSPCVRPSVHSFILLDLQSICDSVRASIHPLIHILYLPVCCFHSLRFHFLWCSIWHKISVWCYLLHTYLFGNSLDMLHLTGAKHFVCAHSSVCTCAGAHNYLRQIRAMCAQELEVIGSYRSWLRLAVIRQSRTMTTRVRLSNLSWELNLFVSFFRPTRRTQSSECYCHLTRLSECNAKEESVCSTYTFV